MSKIYTRNAANTAWGEVKKGFKVRSGSSWIEPKALNYRYNDVWNVHKFSNPRIFTLMSSYDAAVPNQIQEINPETFAVISAKGSVVSKKCAFGGVGQRLYTYNQENRNFEEISPETHLKIRSVYSFRDSVVQAIAGVGLRMYGGTTFTDFYNYANINEYNPSNFGIINSRFGVAGMYGYSFLGGTSTNLYQTEINTYNDGSSGAKQHIRDVNISNLLSTEIGMCYDKVFKFNDIAGTNENLYSYGMNNAMSAYAFGEMNTSTGAVIRMATSAFYVGIAALQDV